jgi:preprotein translocase subunit SecE
VTETTRPAATGDVAPAPATGGRGVGRGGNRIGRFYREVVAELRKVVWPNRQELISYTLAALAFVVVMVAIVGALDLGFAKLVLNIFG